jgi:hypothetical protein
MRRRLPNLVRGVFSRPAQLRPRREVAVADSPRRPLSRRTSTSNVQLIANANRRVNFRRPERQARIRVGVHDPVHHESLAQYCKGWTQTLTKVIDMGAPTEMVQTLNVEQCRLLDNFQEQLDRAYHLERENEVLREQVARLNLQVAKEQASVRAVQQAASESVQAETESVDVSLRRLMASMAHDAAGVRNRSEKDILFNGLRLG